MGGILNADDYLVLQLADILADGAVVGVLNKNGCANWTVCPVCHVDDFSHVDGCRLSEMMEWQSIETAPIDKELLLMGRGETIHWKMSLKVVQQFAPVQKITNYYVWEYLPKPTHWILLPEAPNK